MAKSSCDGLLTIRTRVYSRSATMRNASAGNTIQKTNVCGPLLAARYSALRADIVFGRRQWAEWRQMRSQARTRSCCGPRDVMNGRSSDVAFRLHGMKVCEFRKRHVDPYEGRTLCEIWGPKLSATPDVPRCVNTGEHAGSVSLDQIWSPIRWQDHSQAAYPGSSFGSLSPLA